MRKYLAIILFALLGSTLPANAATYYVATNGSDSTGNGSSGNPWATIQKANDSTSPALAAGDTVIVRTGIYTQAMVSPTLAHAQITKSGTSGNPITFKAECKWCAVIDGSTLGFNIGIMISSNYIVIKDFEIKNTKQADTNNAGFGIKLSGTNQQGIVATGNYIHDIGHVCTGTAYGFDGFDGYDGNNWEVSYNIFENVGRLAAGEQGCSPPNAYYQNHDHDIYVGGPDNLTIKGNLFLPSYRGWAIHFYGGATTSTNNVVKDNVMLGQNPYRDGHFELDETMNGMLIEGNVSVGARGSVVVDAYNSDGNCGAANNCVIRNNIMWPSGTTIGTLPAGWTSSTNLNVTPGTHLPSVMIP